MSAEFRVVTLASGSSGNAIYAECADGAILIDAGISGKRVQENCHAAGVLLDRVAGLILTHDHTDHSQAAGVLARRHKMPLFMTAGTFHQCRAKLQKIEPPRIFRAGQTLSMAGFHIHTVATPHDGVEPVMLVLERENLRCGIFTDLGHPFPELKTWLSDLDAVFLESNYDPEMLIHGPYPEFTKRRIRSPHGHIANAEAGELLRDHASDRLQVVMLSHLSQNNNTPALAQKTVEKIAGERLRENRAHLDIAPRHQPSKLVMLRPRTGSSLIPSGCQK